jgi:hypothetical protein
MQKALQLLGDTRLDILLGEEIAFLDSPAKMAEVFSAESNGLAPILRYI